MKHHILGVDPGRKPTFQKNANRVGNLHPQPSRRPGETQFGLAHTERKGAERTAGWGMGVVRDHQAAGDNQPPLEHDLVGDAGPTLEEMPQTPGLGEAAYARMVVRVALVVGGDDVVEADRDPVRMHDPGRPHAFERIDREDGEIVRIGKVRYRFHDLTGRRMGNAGRSSQDLLGEGQAGFRHLRSPPNGRSDKFGHIPPGRPRPRCG